MQTRLVAGDPAVVAAFESAEIIHHLQTLSRAALDALPFGVIGFDRTYTVQRYNLYESHAAGMSLARVVGKQLFTEVAPCMNNYLIAQRFIDARASRLVLDATIDYVLTLRMQPTKVALRLLTDPAIELAYVLVLRRAAASDA